MTTLELKLSLPDQQELMQSSLGMRMLNLKAFHRIPIITAAEAVNRIAQSSLG